MASGQVKQVDFSKIAARPLLPALDASNNLVYVPALAWAYMDSDGAIAIDFRRYVEWEKRTGYSIVAEPLVSCDEKDCYRDWLDCEKFVLQPNFEIVEMDERSYTLKVRRKSDGVLFKIVNDPKWFYYMVELEPGMTYCEAVPLFIALLAKLGRLKPEDHELLDKDPAMLAAKFGDMLTRPLFVYGISTGLIILTSFPP
jgi:hypothetical protein